jgi:hypothetical protein
MSRVTFQILAIVTFAILLFIGWDFSQRITLMARRQQAEQDLDQRTAQAQATQTALKEVKQRVQSDDYIEWYVRTHWHYLRDNESLVVPQITPAPASASNSAAPVFAVPQTNWFQEFWQFLVGP